jgi:hypothetical protein
MDAGALLTSALPCGRRSRVVLTPRRWRQVPRKQKLPGGDGGKQARSPGRARNKLLKPLRAGMPGDPGATVVTTSCALYLCTRDCGCNGHPAFPAPPWGSATPSWGRRIHAQLGRIKPRERAAVSQTRILNEDRHARACPGHPCFGCTKDVGGRKKTWMAGTSPAMTISFVWLAPFVEHLRETREKG